MNLVNTSGSHWDRDNPLFESIAPVGPLDVTILAPSRPANLSVRKGKWMYIGAKGSGGFTALKRGDHAFGGPAAITYAGYVNSDIEGGKIKPDAPPAQLYDLENDIGEQENVLKDHPDVVKRLAGYLADFADDIAKTSVGKMDKKRLRAANESGELAVETIKD